MKKVVKAVEVEGEGLEALMDEYVVLYCINYFYSGKLIGVNEHDVLLKDAEIVYDAGSPNAKSFKQSEKCGQDLYVRVSMIESYSKRNF